MSTSAYLGMEIEQVLLEQLAEGKNEAFEKLYSYYSPAVYANIRKMVEPADLAEDILQDVFMALWDNRAKIDTKKSVGGWLFVVSYNKAITCLKKKLHEAIIPLTAIENMDIPSEPFIKEATYISQVSILEEAVSHLSPRKREVFRLCHFEGKSYDEVAVALGISVNSVKDYLKQSLSLIKKYVHSHSMDMAGMDISSLIIILAFLSTTGS